MDDLTNEYKARIIEKINLCSKLIARTGMDPIAFDLPKIVVIGPTSAGKTSVVESIVGMTFLPRGVGVVTRCPIEIQLNYVAPDPDPIEDYAVFPKDRWHEELKTTDFRKVTQEILERTGYANNVSDKPIILEIFSCNVITLQLVDLPGFLANPLPGQPDDIGHQILYIVDKYIKKPNTLIMAVASASDEIVNSIAIQRAKEVDPNHERTIAVITKLDLEREPGKVESLVKVLENKTLPLAKGYIGVVNHTQEQILNHTPVETVRRLEEEFFRRGANGAYAHLRSHMGTSYLQKFLNKEFAIIIESRVPDFCMSGMAKLNEIDEELKRLNYSPEEEKKPINYRIQFKIKKFCDAVEVALVGNNKDVNRDQVEAGAAIKWCLEEEIKKACKNAMTVRSSLVERMIEKTVINLDAANTNIGPNSLAFQILVSDLTDEFKGPLKQMVGVINMLLVKHLKKIADKKLAHYSNLKNRVLDLMMQKVDECRLACISDIERQIEVQKIYINSAHPDFKKYQKMIEGKNVIEDDTDVDSDDDESGVDVLDAEKAADVDGAQALQDDDYSSMHMDRENIRTLSKQGGLFSKLQIERDHPLEGNFVRAPTDLRGKKLYFKELIYAYMIIIDKILNDQGQRMVMYHLINNIVEYVKDPELHHKILGLDKHQVNEDEYVRLLEKNTADEARIRSLLAKKESVQETLNILNGFSHQ